MCRDGPGCSRKVCFFAHTIEELRTPSGTPPPTQPAPAMHPGLQAHLSQTGQYASGGLPYACAPLSQGGSSSCFPPTPLDGGAPGGLVFAAAEDYPEGGPVAYMHGGGLDFPNSALPRGSPLEAAAAAGYQYIPAGGGGGGGGYIAVPALGGAMGVAGYLHAPAAAVLAAGGQAQYRQQQQQGGIMLMGGPRGHPSVMMVAAHPDAHHHHHHHQADAPAGAGQAHAHAQAQAAAAALAAQLSLSGGGGGPGQQSGAPMMRLVPLGADGAQQGGVPAHGGWVLAPQHGARGGGHYGVGGGGQF
ncbi:hypothetical protein MNEG_7828 [Monoraphidium neglectum]|uniref:C3H1-type domain-containing protein n=1 Tax=Monoraphidium neglectum TaxID=145388 RepID=A0A0D2MA23_9CHLO|nr:hypothetical protein MNEG_7828 [Monoraphidium neglectum]KIZ00135.1 hypothetical protein MNEG_7828 [Monoraphidium neglectum]|eukprot:XP_013899154.1 hypothetical protein MNEG_7828 [Monoraphidium neglectum]